MTIDETVTLIMRRLRDADPLAHDALVVIADRLLTKANKKGKGKRHA